MRTILKFPFDVRDPDVYLPKGAQVRLVGWQGGDPAQLCIWAEVECADGPSLEGVKLERWELRVFGTGHPMRDAYLTHLGSAIAGPFVWHVYRAGEY